MKAAFVFRWYVIKWTQDSLNLDAVYFNDIRLAIPSI